MAKRVCFIVDGFNVYHSLKEIEKLTGHKVKWLDLRKLLGSYLNQVRQAVGEQVEISRIYYFSALASHLTVTDRGVVNRHSTYISVLQSTGVEVALHRFKAKDIKCPACQEHFQRHEEKETDVAIAVKLLDALARDEGDTVVLVTGDSDLMPAIRTAKALFPHKKIGAAFPFNRRTAEIEQAVDYSFNIRQPDIRRAQFPLQVRLADGTMLNKPATW